MVDFVSTFFQNFWALDFSTVLAVRSQSIRSGEAKNILMPAAETFWNLTMCFIFCFYGEKLTTGYAKINESIYMMDWYLMPIEVQKKVPAIVTMAQRAIYLKGYAKFQCTFEFFKSVIEFFRLKF